MNNRSGIIRDGIDVSRESVLSFADAARFVGKLKGTKKVAFQTLFRWATKGCRGIVLETVFVGGSRCTSVQALQRFFTALTAVRMGQSLSQEPHFDPNSKAGIGATAQDLGDVDSILRQAGIVSDRGAA
jgi:hypothetical protein